MTDARAPEETRIDRWLCAVRLVKTRPMASQLCDAGHVRVNGASAKASTKVRAGDRVDARIADRDRILEVVRPIESRVGAPVAVTCYVEISYAVFCLKKKKSVDVALARSHYDRTIVAMG